MITLVMLHWARPAHVIELLSRYSRYRAVSEVILFANSPPPLLADVRPAPTVIHSNRDLGLYTRFAAAALAANACVLLVDDDLAVPEETVEHLLDRWRRDPAVCHGLFGRDVSRGYEPRDTFGEVEVLLTRCVMTGRDVCIHALQHVHAFDDMPCEPQGNGEDIVLSFSAMARSGRRNRAYPLSFEEMPDCVPAQTGRKEVAINRRWPGHFEHRARLVERCRRHFALTARWAGVEGLGRGARELGRAHF